MLKRRSLFAKLLIIYTMVLVLILFAISVVLRISFQRLYYLDEFRRLENTAKEISDIFIQYQEGQISYLEFGIAVRTFSQATNAIVLITDLEGRILFNSSMIMMGGRHHLGQRTYLKETFMPQLNKAASGCNVRELSISTETSERALNLFTPLIKDNKTLGIIIISQPVQDITGIVKRVNGLIWFVGLTGSLVTVFASFILSKRFTKPIIQLNNAALSMASGRFVPVHVKTDDELEQLANSFNYMGEQLAKQDENHRQFLSTVSHELRTPLTSTLGFIQGMIDGIITAEQQEHYLKITVNEIKRMINLTNDLLDLERIKQGHIQLHRNPFNLSQLMEECIQQLTPLYEDKGVKVTFSSPQQLNFVGDRDRLKQVFVNLLDNAIRYANKRVEIEMTSKTKALEVTIKDDGPGISEEDLPYIFQRFYKGDKSRSTKKGGAGLGLAIAKHLIQLHGGDIYVIPSDLGAVFKVILPKN
ncbi:sensor histidine kinase [Anaerobranca gottschalkii]|uniref:histidine kinase n=1 Tax=Anaerobranca gottschalkii DSM 13577 TaxID=1120990 RepID=A0A1I0AD48_9FIRM|nr:HAMP domain-containing sensor histidine kinase [Anaerobranca gottschalkii]SES92110.1 Signal transduction histidine kinase [Anaerobranca gottschalkii DSM 13577]